MGVDGATPSADAADIAILSDPGVHQMYQLHVARAQRIFADVIPSVIHRGSWIVEHGPNPTDYPRASTNVGA